MNYLSRLFGAKYADEQLVAQATKAITVLELHPFLAAQHRTTNYNPSHRIPNGAENENA